MPLSKAKQREVMRNHMREKRKMFIPNSPMFIPNSLPKQDSVLPWYAGASDHFGEVKSRRYASEFFSNLKEMPDGEGNSIPWYW